MLLPQMIPSIREGDRVRCSSATLHSRFNYGQVYRVMREGPHLGLTPDTDDLGEVVTYFIGTSFTLWEKSHA
jgi:hypothetical protein